MLLCDTLHAICLMQCACTKANKVVQHVLFSTAGRFIWGMFNFFVSVHIGCV